MLEKQFILIICIDSALCLWIYTQNINQLLPEIEFKIF